MEQKKIYLPVADLPDDPQEVNEELARYAKHEIYGSTSGVVSEAWGARKSNHERNGLDLFRPSQFPLFQWMDEYEQFLRTIGISEEVIRLCMGGYKIHILNGFEDKPIKAFIIKPM